MMAEKVIALCCQNSAYQAADMCGTLKIELPFELLITAVPCLGKIDTLEIMNIFEGGASGIIVLGCHIDACRHFAGNLRMRKRLSGCTGLLSECGIAKERLGLHFVSANEPHRFKTLVTEFIDRIDKKAAE